MIKIKFAIILLILLNSCDLSRSQTPPISDPDIFDSPYRELIYAVEQEDTVAVAKLVRREKLNVNYLDARYGISLLRWALFNRKIQSFTKLLELGADPNQKDSTIENVPVIISAAKLADTSLYLEKALKFGRNPDIASSNLKNVQLTDATPLCAAASSNLTNVKVLVENGADINFSPYSSYLPVTSALLADKIDIARYLIVDRNADVKKIFTLDNRGDTVRIGELLRLNVYPLDSYQFKLKMEIVELLTTKGIDYRKTEIPKYLFNNYTKDFLDKY